MNKRELLVAWASTLPDDFVKRAVRAADRKAIDNIDGHNDEHTVFYNSLFDSLGGKRSTGTPRKTRFDADLTKFRHWAGRSLLPGEIATALEIKGATPATSLSKFTIRNRLRAIDKRRSKIAALLEGEVAEDGRALIAIEIAKR